MTTKAAFNADEWSTIVNAPYLAGMLMIASSRGGTMRETMAISRAYASAREHYQGDLLQQVLATPPAFDRGDAPHNPEELRERTRSTLRRAVSLLERDATEDEVNTYKRFIYYVAETVAHAHREGGFLGIGGKEVSEPEQAALDELAAIFDAEAGGPGRG